MPPGTPTGEAGGGSSRGMLAGLDPHLKRLALVVVLGSIMSILDTTIVNVALATLGRDLHATLADIQWVLTGYMLALGAAIPVTGWAARRFGARNVYILSLAIFALFARFGWKKQFAPGCCPKCGYDLRATPDRCPECGFGQQPSST